MDFFEIFVTMEAILSALGILSMLLPKAWKVLCFELPNYSQKEIHQKSRIDASKDISLIAPIKSRLEERFQNAVRESWLNGIVFNEYIDHDLLTFDQIDGGKISATLAPEYPRRIVWIDGIPHNERIIRNEENIISKNPLNILIFNTFNDSNKTMARIFRKHGFLVDDSEIDSFKLLLQ